ncbi:hypothetical protein F4780DRAFT_173684 [Xylariomycetidae sp. FL0641]|nr:hypothetical protein F4780DRAFT_173684 [Xylariomycetidae sp. FL0641]
MEYQKSTAPTTPSYPIRTSTYPGPGPGPGPQPMYPGPGAPPPPGSAMMEVRPEPTPSSYGPPPTTKTNPFLGTDLKTMRAATEFSLREYASLQRRPGASSAVRNQQGIVLSDLQVLRREVAARAKKAEGKRWRKWLLGGLFATLFPLLRRLIPAIRRLFRRSPRDTEANDTEHAWARSHSLIARILASVRRKSWGRLASVAAFVLAVLYVFVGEVALRVARTTAKRLRRLAAKVERGDEEVGEEDLKTLAGWRWRVLLW